MTDHDGHTVDLGPAGRPSVPADQDPLLRNRAPDADHFDHWCSSCGGHGGHTAGCPAAPGPLDHLNEDELRAGLLAAAGELGPCPHPGCNRVAGHVGPHPPPAGPSAEVLAVPEGSIVVLHIATEPELMASIAEALPEVVGHSKFIVLHVEPEAGSIEVWGPDTDLRSRLAELLGQAHESAMRALPADRCTCATTGSATCAFHGAKRRVR